MEARGTQGQRKAQCWCKTARMAPLCCDNSHKDKRHNRQNKLTKKKEKEKEQQKERATRRGLPVMLVVLVVLVVVGLRARCQCPCHPLPPLDQNTCVLASLRSILSTWMPSLSTIQLW